MNELQNISFEKLNKIYGKYFSLNYLGKDASDKFACISLVCAITKKLQTKGKKVNCYDVLLIIEKDSPQSYKDTFLKSLGAICEDIMYGCDTFPTFNLKPQEMPKTVKNILKNYCPF